MEKVPNIWFLAEWISMMGTFIVCFVFLFNQNQTQAARADKLFELYAENQRECSLVRKECNDKFLEIQKEIKQIYIDKRG